MTGERRDGEHEAWFDSGDVEYGDIGSTVPKVAHDPSTRLVSLAHISAVLSDPATVEAVADAVWQSWALRSDERASAVLAVVAEQIGCQP